MPWRARTGWIGERSCLRTNKDRNARRDDTNAIVQRSFGAELRRPAARLDASQIAWARAARSPTFPAILSFGASVLLKRRRSLDPALAASYAGEPERLGDVPTVGQHTEQVRREFGEGA